MGILIDSDILIAYERGQLDLDMQVQAYPDEPFFLSVISASELLHGVWRADSPQRREQRQHFVEGVLTHFPILSIDLGVARVHARLWAELAARGAMIGMNDSWLAATCLAHNLLLLTFNERHFRRIPELRIARWS